MDPVQHAPTEIETAVARFSLGFSRHGLDLLMVRDKINSVHIESQAERQSQNRESANTCPEESSPVYSWEF